MNWPRNLKRIQEDGIFRTMNGTADEFIAIGRIIKAGFNCSKVDIPNAKYDAVVDVGNNQLLRIQIRGVGKGGSVNFMGGTRSGRQISRSVPSREYKYTK